MHLEDWFAISRAEEIHARRIRDDSDNIPKHRELYVWKAEGHSSRAKVSSLRPSRALYPAPFPDKTYDKYRPYVSSKNHPYP